MSEPHRKGRPRGSAAFAWRAFFHHSTTPVFVLGKGRRLRYANPAWEKLTGTPLADALGMVCSARRHSSPLAAALAPTPEAMAGRPDRARRAAPTGRGGSPWWDVTFSPLAGDEGLIGIVGAITVVGEATPAAARKVPPAIHALRDRHAARFTFDLYAGTTPDADRFLAQLRHAATSAAPVWLVGEPGSGKETAARVLHHAGPRRERMFVALDCAGLQPFLVESLFSGHGGLAGSGHVGTVFVKEPTALTRDAQQRFADLFAAGEPSTPRLVCGSAETAEAAAAAGRLVPDFHTALSVIELRLPPLRNRAADVPRFASQWVPGVSFDPATLDLLMTLPWPGNLRELRAVLNAASAAAGTGPVGREHLPWELRAAADPATTPPAGPGVKLDATLETIEKRLITLALARTNGNTSKAADLLGIWRARLLRRVEALGLGKPDQPE